MQLIQEDVSQFRTKGIEAEVLDYEIVDSPELKMLLSGGVYQDKPRAIIRELSTNALDAHIMAKNDKPFDVQLPTYKNPTFRIRDYGTGLSKQQMETMYRQYGNSNKNKDNDFNGCMGIGSKAPFSYANIWTATSYYNGKKHVYQNAKDDKGSPVIVPVGDFDTNEPNGLEVTFNVKPADFNTFVDAAKEVYRPFKLKPNVSGPVGFTPKKHDVKFQGKNGWFLTGTEYDRNSIAVMANVEYPIDVKFFGLKKADELTGYERCDETKYQRLLNAGLVMEFDNGTIQFNIGREALQYTDFTLRQIKEKLDVVFQEIQDHVTNLFKDCKSLWEARLLYKNLKQGNLRAFGSILKDIPIAWNGVNIKEENVDFPAGVSAQYFHRGYAAKPKRFVRNYVEVTANKVAFFINDLELGSYVACERAMDSEGYHGIYLMSFADEVAKKAFCDKVGVSAAEFKLCSSVPKPPKQARKANRDAVYSINRENAQYQYLRDHRKYWTAAEVDLDAGGVYVQIDHWNIVGESHQRSPSNIERQLAKLEALGIVVPKVYGIKTVKIEKFKKLAGWKLFDVWYKEQIEGYVRKNNIQTTADAILAVKELAGKFSRYGLLSTTINDTKNTPATDFLHTIKKVNQQAKVGSEVVDIINVAGSYGFLAPNRDLLKDITTKEEAFLKTYPILKYVSLGQESMTEVLNYISLINKE